MAKVDTIEILKPVDAAEDARREKRVRAGFWRTFRRAARHLPFAQDVVAGYYCALDPKTPKRTRGLLLAALAYFVLPFDIVPDFIFGLGFTDDLAVLTAAFSAIRTAIQPHHREAARQALSRRG